MPFRLGKSFKLRDEAGELRHTPVGGDMLGIGFDVEVIKEPSESRSFWIVASTETIDRDGDVIRAAGWDLKNFRKNPVMPFAHNYKMPPVGFFKASKIEDKQLKQLAHFPEGLSSLSEEIYQAFMAKAMRAFSVGFGAKEVKDDEKIREQYGLTPKRESYWDGILFWRTELWETSPVVVPSNPEALAMIKEGGGGSKAIEEALAKSEDFVIELSEDIDFEPQPEPDAGDGDDDGSNNSYEGADGDVPADATDDSGDTDSDDPAPSDGDTEIPVLLHVGDPDDDEPVVMVKTADGKIVGFMSIAEAKDALIEAGVINVEVTVDPEAIDLEGLNAEDFRREPEPDNGGEDIDLSSLDPQEVRGVVTEEVKSQLAVKQKEVVDKALAFERGEIPDLEE